MNNFYPNLKFVCAFLGLSSLLFGACGSDSGSDQAPQKPSLVPQGKKVKDFDRIVAVVDKGFDLSHPVFSKKVVGSYSLKCPKGRGSVFSAEAWATGDLSSLISDLSDQWRQSTAGYGAPFVLRGTPLFLESGFLDGLLFAGDNGASEKESLKRSFAADDGCTLDGGVSFPYDNRLNEILLYKSSWNAQLLRKQNLRDVFKEDDVKKTAQILRGEDGRFPHGTATAGLIAYKNPKTGLLLIEAPLGEPGDKGVRKCHDDAELKSLADAMEDASVQKSFIEAPMTKAQKKVQEVFSLNQVRIVNYSAGPNSYRQLKADLEEAGCAASNLLRYYSLLMSLDFKREAHLKSQGLRADVVFVQAAGNDGQLIEESSKGACQDASASRLMIGAVDYLGIRADFSNYGDCVTASMLGKRIIIPAPAGFYSISQGTSYAAPMVSRWMSLLPKETNTTQGLQAAFLEAAKSSRGVVVDAASEELAYAKGSSEAEAAKIAELKYPEMLSDLDANK